ncbi:hypothetical protein pipiens_004691 [Culex pipiens pipiens]|uniref:Uncharacterized protein n=1 Tax=Culex pipiens pipiens TaxID=38569 RepID=A0ABD1CG75_CULPP
MATTRIKLGTLLDAIFQIPESGVVNVRLLFELLRALLTRLGLKDLEVLLELDPESSSSHALAAAAEWNQQERTTADDGLFSPSLAALDAEARAEEMARRNAEQTGQVLGLLRGYLVRLQALEGGLGDLRGKRAEDLEVMGKMLGQIDLLDARLCEQEKKLAKVAADVECFGLVVMEQDMKMEGVNRRLDVVEADVQRTRCRQGVVERELALKALAVDLERYVPFECYGLAQIEFGKQVARLNEDIYALEQLLKAKVYELDGALKRKSESTETEGLRKQLAKVASSLNCSKKVQVPPVAAGVSQCLTCGLEASLEGDSQLLPRPVQHFIPSAFKKRRNEVFTLKSRYCGGEATVTKPTERVLLPAPILAINCEQKSTPVVGTNGRLYEGVSSS